MLFPFLAAFTPFVKADNVLSYSLSTCFGLTQCLFWLLTTTNICLLHGHVALWVYLAFPRCAFTYRFNELGASSLILYLWFVRDVPQSCGHDRRCSDKFWFWCSCVITSLLITKGTSYHQFAENKGNLAVCMSALIKGCSPLVKFTEGCFRSTRIND